MLTYSAQIRLDMIERHNAMMQNPSVQRFIWHIYPNFPGVAHVYLFYELQNRTSDELADRAWHELSISAESRMKYNEKHFFDSHFFAKKKDSLFHYSVGNIAIKAWEARETAFENCSQAPPPVPRFVSFFRKQIAEKRIAKSLRLDDSSTLVSVSQLFGRPLSSPYQVLDLNPPTMGQGFDQSVLMYPSDISPTGWEFWNGIIEAGDLM